MTRDPYKWYNPKTGEQFDEPQVGCSMYYVYSAGIQVMTCENIESIVKQKMYNIDYYIDVANQSFCFPSKQALIESLLTPEERLEMLGEWITDLQHGKANCINCGRP